MIINKISKIVNKFLNKLFVKKDLNFMFLSRELIFVLPYLGKISLVLGTRLRQTTQRDLPYCKLKLIFISNCRLNTLFQFKDSPEKKIRSGIIYRYNFSNCKVTYYGKSFPLFYTRVPEHMGFSHLTEKYLKKL